MAIKARGIASSALGTALLGLLLFRAAPTGPTAPTEPSQTKSPSSGALQKTVKASSTKPGSETKQEKTKSLKGPWIASQKHFAGQTESLCPSEIEAGPAAKKAKQAIKSKTSVAFGDGTLQVRQRGSKRDAKYPRRELWCIPDNVPVQAMIATLPDPVQTHMALTFDRTIDAIQLAVGSIHYVIDRYWLPWDIEQKTEWSDYDSLLQATRDQKQKEAQPGLLMFRLDEKLEDGRTEGRKPALLYVFMVGETSTAGINGEQFKNALQYIHDIGTKDSHGCEPGCRIYIMGPMYSGSLASLRHLTDVDNKDTFTIYSGSVSSRSAIANAGFIDFEAKDSSSSAIANAGLIDFQTLVTSTEDSLREVIDELVRNHAIDECRDGGNNNPQVAILSEGGTTYGAVTKPTKSKAVEKDHSGCVEAFGYSREIATLRNAYQQSLGQKPAQDSNAASAKRPSLSSNLADQTNSSDEPPDFSKAQSPFSKEAVLMNFAAAMRHNHYRFIGVLGSNPLDVAFLISFLRDAVPDARLFVLDPDMLLEHEPDNVPYMGTLYVTTYPLISRRLMSMSSRPATRPHLPFSTQYEMGQFNAIICLAKEMFGYDSRDHLSELGVCPPPNVRWKSPVWLTTIGTGGHWPVAMLIPPGQTSWQRAKGSPGTWTALAALLCALAVLHILVLIGLSPFSAKFRDFTLGTVAPLRQLVAINAASATLAVGLALAGLAAWRVDGWTIAAGLLTIGLIVTCLFPSFKYFRWRKAEGTKEIEDAKQNKLAKDPQKTKDMKWTKKVVSSAKVHLLLLLAIWVVAGLLTLMWWKLCSDEDGQYGIFFSYRALHLANVVSPLTPLIPLLTAIYLWAVFEIWRLRFDDMIRPRLKPSGETKTGEGKPHPGWRSEELIATAMNRNFFGTAYGCVTAVFFVVWFLLVKPYRAFELFERQPFAWLYEFLFCLVILLILIGGFRLSQIWQQLRKLLLELNRQRTRVVFSRLKGHAWRSIWFYGSEDADWDYMVQSDEIIQQLKNGIDSPAKSWQDRDDDAVTKIRRTRRKLRDESFPRRLSQMLQVAKQYGELEEEFHCAQDYLARTLNRALDKLDDTWNTQPPWIEEDDGEPGTTDRPIVVQCCEKEKEIDRAMGWHRLLEKYVALRYVAFIRAVLARIRVLLIFLAVSFSLVLISLVIYTFEPHRALIWSVTAIFIVIGFIIVSVLMQMHRDPILSRITGTKANELGLAFYVRIAVLGAAPLLTLLATHFPSIGRYFVSFLQPGLEALK